MFRIRKNFGSPIAIPAFLLILYNGLFSVTPLMAQGPGCTNTMPGSTTGNTGCVTFTYKGQTVTYTTVRAADGNVWLQQNLGAAAVAGAKTDTTAYGDLFQWGRWDDGHQARNSATGAAPAANNPTGLGPGSTQFIVGLSTAAWWNGGQLTDTWDATDAAANDINKGADPCKAIGNGWRLPTQAEWAQVVTDEAITNPDQAFGSNLKLTVSGSRSSSSGNFDFVGARGYYWSSTPSTTGGKYYYFSAAVNNPNAGNTRGGGAAVRCLNTTGSVSVVDSVDVRTLNNAAPTIAVNSGTLQMQASVFPAIASQAVTWSIIPVSGAATINASGLVTAQSNGTVWAKAVSVADITKYDSLLITISNQVVPVTAINVTTQNNIPAVITSNAGTLQMTATILPTTANQSVTWSIIPGTGNASISATGLVTALANGTVWAKAVAVTDATQTDSLQVTISNQAVPATAIDVNIQNNAPAVITANNGTLQVVATVLPANASQNVNWSIVPGTGAANISSTGLVTAQSNGTVWAKAISTTDAGLSDSLQITISGQATTGMEAKEKEISLEIYPNPVQHELLISIGSAHPHLEVQVVDIYGRSMFTGKINAGTGKSTLTIPAAGLTPGTYSVVIRGEGIHIVHKIVKR